jgi:hypothetical protein
MAHLCHQLALTLWFSQAVAVEVLLERKAAVAVQVDFVPL